MPDSNSIKSVISLKDYYARIHFGFAAARLALPQGLFRDCTELPSFSALEIPLEQFMELAVREKENLKKRFPVIHCGSLLEPQISRLILDAGPAMQQEFVRTGGFLLKRMQQEEIPCGVLDFNLISVLQDLDRKRMLEKLFRKMYPDLQRTGRILLLPVHVPFASPDDIERVSKFLRDMMIPNLKLRLSIYPHELKPDFDPFELAGNLRLETRSVLFCCNSDAGNKLMQAHLTPWMRYFALTSFPGPFFFCPFSHENRLASVAAADCAELAAKLLSTKNLNG